MPVMILLVRGRQMVTANPPEFTLGRGLFGYVVNWTSVLFVLVTSIFFCFPPAIPVNVSTMNYVTAVVGIFVVYAISLWFVKKKSYNGPKFELILGEELPVANPITQEHASRKEAEFLPHDKD
ncbi:amino acid permease [Colletotrichum higginsianum]|nr:amino acid permease [Colletotrichum higginsianum]